MAEAWEEPLLKVLQLISIVIDVLLFPIYFFIQKPWEALAASRRVRAKPITWTSNSVTYRSVDEPREIHTKMLYLKIDTLEKSLTVARKLHQNRRCLGTRKIIREVDEIQPNGRSFKKYEMGDYQFLSYIEVDESAAAFGRGLREVGVKPLVNIAIFAETRAEWMIAAHACFKNNVPIVTIYATLGEEGIVHAINETEITTIITSHELMPKFKNILKLCPELNLIIFMEDQLEKTNTTGFKDGVQIIPFTDVMEKGKTSTIEGVSPKPDDIAIIMYTSGSTGVPKGVMLSHTCCITTMKNFSDGVHITDDETMIGFLPLAHVIELLAESVCFILGVPVGYSNALTLIDTSSKILTGTKGDATVLRPTALPSVPLILDRIVKGVREKVRNEKPIKRVLFKFGFEYKKKWIPLGFTTPLIDKVVFKKLRMLLGGRVKIMISGGAPLSTETQEFMKICFSLYLQQGYGLTECTASCGLMDKFDLEYGHNGAPGMMTDIRLENWEEGGYMVTDKPNPRGEVIVGGDNVAIGYFKQPEKTAEEFFDEDGRRWFRTGDIGEIIPTGALKIVDRKKDLVKLQHGEYISLGKIETELKVHPICESICVYADSTKLFSVALITPNPIKLADYAAQYGVTGEFEELCLNQKLIRIIYQEIVELAHNRKLIKFEVPGAIYFVKEQWLPETGLVTAAFKLKRKQIETKYRPEIDQMYKAAQY